MECALPVGEMYLEVPTSSSMMFEDVQECLGMCRKMFEDV